MDKEEFLKRKAKIIVNNFYNDSDVIGKIIAELLDIYDEGFNEGYDKGYYDGYRDWY